MLRMSEHGLKYEVTDHLCDIVDEQSDAIQQKWGASAWGTIDWIIEGSEGLPSLCGIITFCVLSLNSNRSWWEIALLSLLARAIGLAVSYIPLLFKLSLINLLLNFYSNYLLRFGIPYIIAVVIGIIVKPWYFGLAYLAICAVSSTLSRFTISSYKMRRPFNDAVVHLVLKRFPTISERF